MKVVMLAKKDWANTGWRFSKCLELLKYDVHTYKLKYTRLPHPHQMNRVKNFQGVRDQVVDADVIHFIASEYIGLNLDMDKYKVVVNHGGSKYRRAPGKVNRLFNPFVDASLIQCPDLLGLGALNEHLIYYPVDTDFIKPDFGLPARKLRVGHFPSSTAVKGTRTILNSINRIRRKINYVGIGEGSNKTVGWLANLERMKACDVIIETVRPSLKGKRYGEWGNTALEASSSGCIVITNCLSRDVYEAEYGCELPLLVANNGPELDARLYEVLSMSADEIQNKKYELRQWAEDYHSFRPTAKRLHERIYRHFEG